MSWDYHGQVKLGLLRQRMDYVVIAVVYQECITRGYRIVGAMGVGCLKASGC